VLLTDGDLKVTFPVLRTLAMKGIETGVAATHSRAMSFYSKYCKNKLLYPSPRENLTLFLNCFQKIVKKTDYDILFPIGEWTLVPVSENREKIISHIKLPLPSKEAMRKTFDKSLTVKLAQEENVPIPKTFHIENLRDLKEVSKRIRYPAVIKSRRSWVWNRDKTNIWVSRPRYVNSPQELVSTYKTMHSEFPYPIIQEYVPGLPYHVGVLCSHSRLRAICCIKEHRTIPVTGGYATLRETVELDQRMKEYALRLLRALNWHGVAEVEFKLDPRDSVPRFMEINGRFWGSLELAMAAGVDFPYLLYLLAVDGDVKPVLNYKVGIKRRWLEGDFIYILNVLKNVDWHPNVEYPDKWHALAEFLKIHSARFDCLYWDDPLPFLSRFLWGDIPGILFRKISRKIKASQRK
jgi:predicted ATP-grasp superfamily ATP-dependent carboligase